MKLSSFLPFVVLVTACAAGPPSLPYPAYIAVDELPEAFVAGLPGVRARQLSSDPDTQRTGYRIAVPADWSFTTGASPGLSVEVYVLAGTIRLGEFELTAGGYAYLPPGHAGWPMQSDNGALLLYFLDDPDDRAVIGTPLLTNSSLLPWQAAESGVYTKELRADPGSGARTWLLRIEPGANLPWQRSSQPVEGYLLSGAATWTECSDGQARSGDYLPGGYFHRPPAVIHAGPDSGTSAGATWYLRVPGADEVELVGGC